jgi:hypothetical protein
VGLRKLSERLGRRRASAQSLLCPLFKEQKRGSLSRGSKSFFGVGILSITVPTEGTSKSFF